MENALEIVIATLRKNSILRNIAVSKPVRQIYVIALKLMTGNRGLHRKLYPGVDVRVSYESRQTMECDFRVTAEWDVPTLAIIRRYIDAKRDICFFDVGANQGQFTLVVSRWAEQDKKNIYAFEPHPRNRRVLTENITRNGCRNVEVVECALGAAPGNMTLYGESVTASLSPIPGALEVMVKVDTLDCFCSRLGIEPDIIKIDVEGFELDVLRGAIQTLTRNQDRVLVLCEMHTFMWPDADFDLKLMELANSCGLKVFRRDGTVISRISTYGHYVLAKTFE